MILIVDSLVNAELIRKLIRNKEGYGRYTPIENEKIIYFK